METNRVLSRWALAYGLVAPAFLVTLCIVAYPIFHVVVRSFQAKGQSGFSLDNYRYLFTNAIALQNLFFTLTIVLLSVFFATFFAYGLALYLRFSHTRLSRLIGSLYILPRFIPGLVAVNGMITVIRDSGLLNRIGLVFGYDFKPGLMFTDKGIILMNTWFNIPFAAMLILAALSNIPDAMIESARDAGAPKRQILARIIVPLTGKDVLIAATFIFMSNVGSFTTPYLIGSTSPQMLGISLFNQFNNIQYERASALSVLMFALCGVSAAVYIYTNLRDRAWEKQE